MLSLIKLPLSVAVLAVALAPAVESTSQKWIPRGLNMENMVVDLGGEKFSTSGSQCKLQDLSNEPILSFSNAQANQTYLAAALSFSIQSPTDTQADSFDPLQLFSGSTLFLSYLQTSMQSRTDQSTILSSQRNPLVPFQLPEPSCGEDILIVILVSEQPHPLLAGDCFIKQFAEMEENSSKRKDYKIGGFWESAALGEVSAATWLVINNDNAECGNESANTAGGGGPQLVTVSTESADTTTTTTTTIPAASAVANNTAQAAVDGGAAVQTTTITTVKDGKSTTLTTTIPASSAGVDGKSGAFAGSPQGFEAVVTTTITTEINGTPTCITTTVPATSVSSTSGKKGEVVANGEKRNKKSPESPTPITTTITSTGTITTTSGSSTITTTTTTTFISTITSPAPSNSAVAEAEAATNSDNDSCDDEGSNNENKPQNESSVSESASYVTSVKTITKTITNDKGSKVEQVTTTTETSAIVNLQAPVAQGAAGEPNPAQPSTTTTTGQSPLESPVPIGFGVGGGGNNSSSTVVTTTSARATGNAAPSAGAAQNTKPPVQTAGAVDTQPAVLAAVLMGSLGGFYFAFM